MRIRALSHFQTRRQDCRSFSLHCLAKGRLFKTSQTDIHLPGRPWHVLIDSANFFFFFLWTEVPRRGELVSPCKAEEVPGKGLHFLTAWGWGGCHRGTELLASARRRLRQGGHGRVSVWSHFEAFFHLASRDHFRNHFAFGPCLGQRFHF